MEKTKSQQSLHSNHSADMIKQDVKMSHPNETNSSPKADDVTSSDTEDKVTDNLINAPCIDAPEPTPSKCVSCRKACTAKCVLCCVPCMTKHNPLPASPTRKQRFTYGCMCPPHGRLARWLTLVLALVFLYGTLYGITGDEALPGGNIFGLLVLIVACLLGGALVEKIKLPALLGMLIVGSLLKNVPYINVAEDIDPAWSGSLRSMALVVILIRAGLGLDPDALRKLSFGVIRLAFLPCLAETLSAAVMANLLLGFPWPWGFMLGFVLAAVSPAVVVPSMLSLQQRGLGVDQGIPTLVIAAASIDDVLAISGFGVVLGVAFAKGNLALTIVKGPLEAIAGVAFGIVFGIVIWFLPHFKHPHKASLRTLLLLCGGLLAQFVSRRADISGAGALGCLTLAFVAALRWRREVRDGDQLPQDRPFGLLWKIFQPLLFGLIGAELDIMEIQLKTVGLGIALLCIGLVLRMVISGLAVLKLGYSWKEIFFIPLAWLPKATVQAAIGSIALDTAREKVPQNPDDMELGKQVLTMAVLSILLTAPLGAAAIALSAPRLLQKKASESTTETADSGENLDGKPRRDTLEVETQDATEV